MAESSKLCGESRGCGDHLALRCRRDFEFLFDQTNQSHRALSESEMTRLLIVGMYVSVKSWSSTLRGSGGGLGGFRCGGCGEDSQRGWQGSAKRSGARR